MRERKPSGKREKPKSRKWFFDQLVLRHEKELENGLDLVERIKNSPSFEEALKTAEARNQKIKDLLITFDKQKDLFKEPHCLVEVGAIVTCQVSQPSKAIDLRILITESTEVRYLIDGQEEFLAMDLSSFRLRKIGDQKKYRMGRAGEEFFVTETLISIE